MKKLLPFLLLLLSTGCVSNLDPAKPWRVANKSFIVNSLNEQGLCNYKVTDGNTSEQFCDSCSRYRVGDTCGHPLVKSDTTKIDTIKKIIDSSYNHH